MGIRQFFSRKPDVMPSGDDVLRIGNTFYGSRGTYHADGAALYGPDGRTAFTAGNETFCAGGRVIRRVENIWYAPEGMYILAGDILYGPNGKGWTPVRACDVIGIIETCQDF